MTNADDPGSIRLLRGLDAVRLRPQLYAGDVRDGSGLHRMIELAVADALARRPREVAVTLHADGGVGVADDGAPFPVAIETALSGLMMYQPGWLAIVAALSSRLDVRLRRDGEERRARFADGRLVAASVRVEAGSTGDPHSTDVTFRAADEVFGAVTYDRALVARLLRDLGRREPGVRLRLV